MSSLLVSEPVSLAGRHIYLTGGTGFLGRCLLDYLFEIATIHGCNFKATVLSRDPEKFLRHWPEYSGFQWLTFVRGDVACLPTPGTEISDMIHGAGVTHASMPAAEWIDQIVGGTERALSWAANSMVERFLFVSSGAVYGPQPMDMPSLPETYLGAPPTTVASSLYGQAKRLAEQLCTTYAFTHRLEAVIARCFAIVAPHVPFDGPYAIGNFLADAINRETIRVRGNGRAVRSYLYGRDVAHWIFTMLRSGVSGQAYNVGSDIPVTIADLADLVSTSVSPRKEVVIEETVIDDGTRSIYIPNIAKASTLGLSVETSLSDAILLSLPQKRVLNSLPKSQ